ncbi:MAG: hypothetical protein RBT34_09165 [Anaerolineaceae bacterium]|jgi:hypothetical protein|nr:hypothetical protein [Anaerolineaceae bacterium]
MNRSTRIIIAVIGIMLAIAGISHGFFEVLQGNTPTGGIGINAIGPDHIQWEWGGEGALTLVPNFLLTGLLAITVSIAIAVWSVGFVHKKGGATVFILLFVALFLVGGGVAQLVFFLPAWGVASRINKPLTWWRKVLPARIRPALGKIWPVTLSISVISFLIGLYIAITGRVPGFNNITDADTVLAICWSFIFGGGWAMNLLTYVSGFADDIERRIQQES